MGAIHLGEVMAKKSASKPKGLDIKEIQAAADANGAEHWGITFRNGAWEMFKVSASVKPISRLTDSGWD